MDHVSRAPQRPDRQEDEYGERDKHHGDTEADEVEQDEDREDVLVVGLLLAVRRLARRVVLAGRVARATRLGGVNRRGHVVYARAVLCGLPEAAGVTSTRYSAFKKRK